MSEEMEIMTGNSPAPKVRNAVAFAAGILIVLGVVTTYTSSTETMLPAGTELFFAAGTPAPDCSNVLDWNFFHATVTQNNLGGVGPNKGDAQEIRYAGVADETDLVLTINNAFQKPAYVTNDKFKDKPGWAPGYENNGINGKFGQVNVRGGTSVAMEFTLVEAGTYNPIDISPNQKFFFSVYDLDSNGGTSAEYVKFTTPVDSYKVTSTSTAKVSGGNNKLVAVSGRTGNEDDNPSDPLALTAVQKDSTVWVTYKGRNKWGMTFGESGNPKQKGGRNLLFAGRAEGDCPPGPVKPPPGSCTAGIQGMIKGGGKVCCPDECGLSGVGQKWADAPNACGGPGCDKGPDGKRTGYRYDNCCVGKPVAGGTAQATITAPYGIVSQGRFCTGLGSDAPPCIDKLSKLSDRL